MDVGKMFQRAPEQGEAVPKGTTKVASPLKAQKKEILSPDVEDETVELDSAENEGWPHTEATEAILKAPIAAWASMTQPYDTRHPLSARFHALLKEVGELHDKKQKDYGTASDPFANVRGATKFGLPAPMGAFIAMGDIMSRIESFCINGRLENEPLDNALKDMAVYSLIALVLHEEENGKVGE
jgi:hypothetical protein